MDNIVSFSEEDMDSTVNKGRQLNKDNDESDSGLHASFNAISDESGGDIAQSFNQYVQSELNPELEKAAAAYEDADQALNASRNNFSEAKDTIVNHIHRG